MYNTHLTYNPYGYGYQQPIYNRASMPTQEVPMQMQLPPQQLQLSYLKGRPVASVDEARASQIDLDGSLYVFPDLGNKKIYTKQINTDGTVAFNVFELSTPNLADAPQAPTVQYVTREELDSILAQFKETLKSMPSEQPKAAARNNTFNL